MNKHLVTNLLLLFIFVCGFAACSNDDSSSYAPVYGSMTFNPSPATPGDSVTATVEQKSLGYGLEKTTYTWTIKYGVLTEDGVQKDTSLVLTKKTNYDGYENGHDNPSIRFLIPSNCTSRNASVSLSATFSGYIGNTLFCQANKSGTLSIK